MNRARWALATATALPMLVGCSGDDSGDAEPGGPREQVDAYVAAFSDGDPDVAWELVSDRCRASLLEDEFRAAVAAAGELYDLQVSDYTESIEGDTATASYAVGADELEQTDEPWVRQADGWRWDDC